MAWTSDPLAMSRSNGLVIKLETSNFVILRCMEHHQTRRLKVSRSTKDMIITSAGSFCRYTGISLTGSHLFYVTDDLLAGPESLRSGFQLPETVKRNKARGE